MKIPQEYILPFTLVPDLSISRAQTLFAVMPGTYQDWRFYALKNCWNEYADKLFITGTRGDPEYDVNQVATILGVDISKLVMQGFAEHTRAQMDWLVREVLKVKPTQVILSTAAYHLPRCTLTFVKAFIDKGETRTFKLALLPTADPSNPSTSFSPEQIIGEVERIPIYQSKGDVATLAEYLDFLK